MVAQHPKTVVYGPGSVTRRTRCSCVPCKPWSTSRTCTTARTASPSPPRPSTTVQGRPGRLGDLSVLHSKYPPYCFCLWAHRALNGRTRRFPAREVAERIERPEAQLQRSPGRDLHGRAGSIFLFNSSALHAAHLRAGGSERKSVQIYYRRLSHEGGPIAAATVVPTSLTRDHPDADVRRFYGASVNERTRVYALAFQPPRL